MQMEGEKIVGEWNAIAADPLSDSEVYIKLSNLVNYFETLKNGNCISLTHSALSYGQLKQLLYLIFKIKNTSKFAVMRAVLIIFPNR